MLREPEASIVAAWLEAGNAVLCVPFGTGGKSWSFNQTARRSGTWGAFKRFGGKHIEQRALGFIASGHITTAQARVGLVWQTLRSRGPMGASQLGRALELDKNAARKVLNELLAIECGERVANARFETVRAVGASAPHWSDYLEEHRPAQSRAA